MQGNISRGLLKFVRIMASRFKVFTHRFFVYTNIILVFVFLLSCLVAYLNPQKWWFIAFLGLAFPFLLFMVLLYIPGWILVRKPRLALVSGIAVLISLKSLLVFFAFHPGTHFTEKKAKNNIRVLSWNVARFIELKRNTNKGSQVRREMFDLIRKQDADILCLQEFHTSTNPEYYDNISAIREELKYPYYYFSFDTDGDNHFYSSIIFSRYPIVDSGKVRYPRPAHPDVLLQADIKVNSDTVRVFTTHLQSLQFDKKDYEKLHKIKTVEDSLVSNSRSIISKMKKGYSYRSLQAGIVHEMIGVSPHPVIFCGDMNDVPNSYTYFKVKGDMQDAFLKKGFGIGRTFTGISPTLRIDYIFADKSYKISQFKRVTRKLSDHYMLVADLELTK